MKTLFAVALVGLASTFHVVRAETSLYIADQAAEAIYVRNSEDPSARPLFLSGQLDVSASSAVFLDRSRMVFQPFERSHLIAMVDTATGELELIHEFMDADQVYGLSIGPVGEIVCPFVRDSLLVIGELTPDGDGWSYSETTVPDGEIENLRSIRVYKTSSSGYFIAVVPFEFFLYYLDTDPDLSLQELEVGDGAAEIYMNRTDRRILVTTSSRLGSLGVGLNSFEPDGTPIQDFAVSDSKIWQTHNTLIDWGSSPDLVGVSVGRIATDNDPYTDFPTTVFDGFTSGVVDTKRDPSGAVSLYRPENEDWAIYDNVNQGIFDVDLETDTLTKRFHLERGEGPPLNRIHEIVVGSDDLLYVLSQDDREWKILRVDPLTGDRSVYVELPGNRYLEGMDTDADGKLRVISFEQNDGEALYRQVVVSITDSEPDLQELAPYPFIGTTATDVNFMRDGSVAAIWSDDYVKKVTKSRDGVLADLNTVPLIFSGFSVIEDDGFVYTLEATATVSDSPGERKYYVVENEHRMYLPGDLSYGVDYELPMELTTPSGKVVETICNMTFDFDSVEQSYNGKAVFKFPGEDATGTWRLRIVQTNPRAPINQITHVARAAGVMLRQPMQVEELPEYELLIRESYPFAMTRFNPNAETATDVTPSLSDELMAAAQYVGDFLVLPSGEYFLSSLTTTDVIMVSASGEATIHATGRPAEVDAELLGLPANSLLHLAVGPRVVPDLGATGWVLE